MVQTRRDPEQRPSPEALLEAARREDSRAGRLKIFVGAAPGVGKTYEMLQSAHARKKAGIDVVVGVVETHGRAETETLLKGLEVLPRRRLAYKEQTLEEMDLDALIARRPQDRKSTRLNSSHVENSYAVFCFKKKNTASAISTALAAVCITVTEQEYKTAA